MRTFKKEEYTDVLMDSRILLRNDSGMIKDVRLDEEMMRVMPIFCEKVGVQMIHMVFMKKKNRAGTYDHVYERVVMDMVSKGLEQAVNDFFNDRRPDIIVCYATYDGYYNDFDDKGRAYDRLIKLRSHKSVDYFDRVNDIVDNGMFVENGGVNIYPVSMDKCIMIGDLNGNMQDLDWLCSKELHIPFMDKKNLMMYG